MRKFRVLVSDSVDPTGIDILRSIAEVDVKTKLTEDQLCDIIGDYDALMVRSGTRVTKRVIQCGTKLKIVGRAGVGVDNVDVDMATRSGIFVVNSPQGNTVAAAELTVGLLFALARKITLADASLRAGKWEREKFMGSQLQHKTLGIIGLGQVGCHVAKICREIGMELICYDPYINKAKAESLGCRIVELDELLEEADVVTLHVPLLPATKNLINEEKLRLMKNTAVLINCARGGIVDEAAVCSALREGTLAGAALDVFENEGKMEMDSQLLSTPNLLLTPHIGASTNEAQVNVAIDVAQQIRSTLLGSLPESAVNIPGLRLAELEHLRPIIECCEILGRIAVQLLDQALERIVVGLDATLSWDKKSEMLLMAAANGAIGVHKATRVNFVNVRQIAEKHHIKMVLIKDESSLKGSITVEVTSSGRSARIRGMMTEDNEVLLKSFDGIPIYMILPTSISRGDKRNHRNGTLRIVDDKNVDDFAMNGIDETTKSQAPTPASSQADKLRGPSDPQITLLYSRHEDVPGVLAAITAVLGDAGINIGNCHLGRERRPESAFVNRDALAIFHVDGECPPDVAEKVQCLEAVRVCKILKV